MKAKLRFTTLFADPLKEKYENVKPTQSLLDAGMIKANSKYYALSWFSSGGGVVAALNANNVGRLPTTVPLLRGHNGVVQDFDFYPFNENMIATASEDTTIKIWTIPEPFEADVTTPDATLNGHHKKVNFVQFNPVAESILASASFDNTVKIWNVAEQSVISSIGGAGDSYTALEWNHNGSLIGLANRDKKIRIADPRSGAFVHEFAGHKGPKVPKVCWIGNTNYFFSSGFAQSYERQFFLWDMKNLTEPIQSVTIDNMAGSLYPFFDSDCNVLYLAGKGDGNIRYYEFAEGNLHYLNQHSSTTAQKGVGFLPKRCVDTKKNELARCVKLTNNNTLEFVTFRALRKSELFQEDLYPDCVSEEPALTSEKWVGGENSDPKRKSMKPNADNKKIVSKITFTEPKGESPEKAKTQPQEETKTNHAEEELKGQLQDAKAEISRLKEESDINGQENIKLTQELNELKEKFEQLKAELAAKDARIAELEGSSAPKEEAPVEPAVEGGEAEKSE